MNEKQCQPPRQHTAENIDYHNGTSTCKVLKTQAMDRPIYLFIFVLSCKHIFKLWVLDDSH